MAVRGDSFRSDAWPRCTGRCSKGTGNTGDSVDALRWTWYLCGEPRVTRRICPDWPGGTRRGVRQMTPSTEELTHLQAPAEQPRGGGRRPGSLHRTAAVQRGSNDIWSEQWACERRTHRIVTSTSTHLASTGESLSRIPLLYGDSAPEVYAYQADPCARANMALTCSSFAGALYPKGGGGTSPPLQTFSRNSGSNALLIKLRTWFSFLASMKSTAEKTRGSEGRDVSVMYVARWEGGGLLLPIFP